MLEIINVNPNSDDPIYKQLQQQIVRLIVGGQLRAGDELPSVRAIAEHFTVNPMTVSRAMSQLTDQGWIERRRGQPSRVAESSANKQNDPATLIHQPIDELIQQAQQLGISKETLLNTINIRWSQKS